MTTTKANIADTSMSFEVGRLAGQANGAVLATWGETVVLATATMSNPNEGLDYFPLTVEYIEKYYAGGVISSSRFVKRERFPSNEAILSARLIDRSIRPLFPKNFMNEVQVIVTVLSYDNLHDPAILGLNAASAALSVSDIPFDGPVAGINIGLVDGEFKLFPDNIELEKSKLNLTVSCTDEAVVMLEAGAFEIPEEEISEGIELAFANTSDLLKAQNELREKAGKPKAKYEENDIDKDLYEEIKKEYGERIASIPVADKNKFHENEEEIHKELFDKYEGEVSKNSIREIVFKIMKESIRKRVLEDEVRLDGRKLDEVRHISAEVGILPRVHGSGLFNRGQTQVLSTVTLGSPSKELTIEGMEGEETKRYVHHYNFPPYSTGEAGRFRYMPGRRELGHGALAEKALIPVLPDSDEFPYMIRVVSEVMSSDGSTSMASTCGSTLSLMDAGVPIKKPVSGVAMGLIYENGNYKVLTDIAGFEDHIGDMDFKVTGTKDGVTAIQMDNKLKGVPVEVLKDGIKKAKAGRLFIMDKMLEIISAPSKGLSKYAPKLDTMRIPKDKIGEVIGPGGKIIKGIIEETGVDVNIDDEGIVVFSHTDQEAIDKAKSMVASIIEEPVVGRTYVGVVDKIVPYGAFVDVSPNISGLLHVSEISDGFVKDVSDHLKEGQNVRVKIVKIENGKVSFTMKGLENKEEKEEEEDNNKDSQN